MKLSSGQFWTERYCAEGSIWGEVHSPTAALLVSCLPPNGHVLEIGFGYGRDLVFLAKHGFQVSGVEPSCEGGLMAKQRLDMAGLQAKELSSTTFEETDFSFSNFSAVLSHRMLHLLTTKEEIEQFVLKLMSVAKPGALLCIGARDMRDLDLNKMLLRGSGVYEYRDRKGHLVSYWDESLFRKVFEPSFEIVSFHQVVELESKNNPVPCYLTIMLARRF
jgi:SAM-dependent methyltransferase